MTRILIGFAGRKGAGKDTATEIFSGAFENVKLAGALKAMLAAFLAYQGLDDAMVRRMIEGDLKETPSDYLGGRTPRYAMQHLGDEWGRQQMAEDLWVDAAERRIGLFEKVVVTDVRYQNEVDLVRRLGGRVFRIERPGLDCGDTHPSEAGIHHLQVDGVIENTAPDAETFSMWVAMRAARGELWA